MFKKFSIKNSIFAGLALSFFFLGQAGAQTITVSGTVFTDEGITPMADGRTVRLKANGLGNYSDVTSTTGDYSISNVPAAAATVLTVFLDSAPFDPSEEKGTTIMVVGSEPSITNVDIYQNHIIIRSDDDDSFRGVGLLEMSWYDKDQDDDILFDAEDSDPNFLLVDQGNVFYIWPTTSFFPMVMEGSTIDVDDIKILGSFVAIWTMPDTYVSGDWINLGEFVNGWGMPVTFDSGNGTKYIASGSSYFDNVIFNDGGGAETWVLEDDLNVTADLTIISGTLDVNAVEDNAISIEGSWTNSGTFRARNGTVTFDDNTPNSRIITTGGSPFYNLTFSASNSSTPDLVSSYTLEDPLEVVNDLTINDGILDTNPAENNAITIGGHWMNLVDAASGYEPFIVNNGTVTFNGTGIQYILTGSSNWNGLEVTNNSAAVIFVDKFTCATLTCTAPGARLNFKFREVPGERYEITAPGGLHLEGAAGVGEQIVLRRFQGQDAQDCWDIYPSGGLWTVSYVDVKDSINSYPKWINPSNSFDAGNNFNWFSLTVLDSADLILRNIDIQNDVPASLSVTPIPGEVRAVE